jgi:hypothetical protein
LDLGGNPIGNGTGFVIGVGANPGLTDLDEEIRRFEFKVAAGAEYAVTQPVFDIRLLENFLRRIEHCRIPVIAGIWPLVSVRNAEFMKNELRVSVPDAILERMPRVWRLRERCWSRFGTRFKALRSVRHKGVIAPRWMFSRLWGQRLPLRPRIPFLNTKGPFSLTIYNKRLDILRRWVHYNRVGAKPRWPSLKNAFSDWKKLSSS